MEAATVGDPRSSSKVEDWAATVLSMKVPSVMKPFSPPITPYKYLSIGEINSRYRTEINIGEILLSYRTEKHIDEIPKLSN